MASVKIKFRASRLADREGAIYYQIIHERVVRQIATEYRVYSSEWNEGSGYIAVSQYDELRKRTLANINGRISVDINRLNHIIAAMQSRCVEFSADDVVRSFELMLGGQTIFKFTQAVITLLRELRKERCVETYTTTLKSFMRFRSGEDLLLNDITSDLMLSYEAYLKYEGVAMNTISFYMRILRAIYNRAVEQELVEQNTHLRRYIQASTRQ